MCVVRAFRRLLGARRRVSLLRQGDLNLDLHIRSPPRKYRSNPSRPGDGTLGIASEEVITPHAGVLGKPGSRPQIYCRVAQASHVLVLICKLGCARLTSSGDRRSRDCAFDRRLTIGPSSTIVVGALRRWRENRSLLPMLVTPDVPVGRVAYSGGACGRCIPVPTERSVRDQRRGC